MNSVLLFINNFNNFVNQFVASYDLCSYSVIAQNYLAGFSTALLNFLVNFTGNIAEVMPVLWELIQSFGGESSITTGYYLGEFLRLCTGISFKELLIN